MKTFKAIITIILVLAATVAVSGVFTKKDIGVKDVSKKPDVVDLSPEVNAIQLCFEWKNEGGDRALLSMDLRNENVIGELYWLPLEKDYKTGIFKGTVSDVDKMMMARTVNAFWETRGEGMEVKEELKIIFGEGNASIGFGEMKDRGDGVYVYANPDEINYSLNLTDVACGDDAMD